MNSNYNLQDPNISSDLQYPPNRATASAVTKFKRKSSGFSDRFIPYQGSRLEKAVSDYKKNSSREAQDEFYWTRYRKELAEACFDIPFEDFKGLGVQLWKPAPQIDHSLIGEYRQREVINQMGARVLKTRAPIICEQIKVPQIPNNAYLNLMDVSSQDFLAVGDEKNVHYKSLGSDSAATLNRLNRNESVEIASVRWMHESTTLVVGTDEGDCEVWDVEQNSCQRTIDLDGHVILISTPLNNHSPIFFAGNADNTIYKCDLRLSSPLVCQWTSEQKLICGLRVSPDEKWIISGSNNNKAHVWDVNGGAGARPLAVLDDFKACVKAVAWHPSSRFVCTGAGASDQMIKIWDLAHVEQPVLLCSQKTNSQVTSLQWVKNRLFATSGFGSPGNELSSWRVDLKNHSLSKEHGVVAHEGRIFSSAHFQSGSKLATLGADSLVTVWDSSEVIVQEPSSLDMQRKSQALVSQFSIR